MLMQPPEDFQAVFDGHLQIQQKERREGIGGAVGVLSFAGEVINRFFPVAHGVDGIKRLVFLERPAHQENVVRIVLGQQDRAKMRHSKPSYIYSLFSARRQARPHPVVARPLTSARSPGPRAAL